MEDINSPKHKEFIIRLTILIEDLLEGIRLSGRVVEVVLVDDLYEFVITGITIRDMRRILPDFISITKYPRRKIKVSTNTDGVILFVPIKKH